MSITPEEGFTLDNCSTDDVISGCLGSYLMGLLRLIKLSGWLFKSTFLWRDAPVLCPRR